MTLQAILFLHRFKSVQMQENGSVWLDAENKLIQTVKTSPTAPSKTYPLTKQWDSVFSIIDYLESKKLLMQTGSAYFSLTHAGFHYLQNILSNIAKFLLKSVLVPIVVAILTTLISLWPKGLL